ncbi:MAG: cobaltochelatase subunit CobT, partial [Bdellovibrionales bacterium]
MTTDTPVEIFKRATALAIKAIGHKTELEVGFTTEPSGVSGSRVRVPLPSAGLPHAEVAFVRGAADAVALRLRHHDARLHAREAPASAVARSAFEALEQARCEGLGARQMEGVAANIAALLEEKCRQQGFARAGAKAEVPLADVLRLLAYEKFSGHPLPPSARRAAELWRAWIEERAGASFGNLQGLMSDQKAYAAETHRLLKAMDMEMPGKEEEGETREEKDEGSSGAEQDEKQMSPSEAEGQQGEPETGAGEANAENKEPEEGRASEQPGDDGETPSDRGRNWHDEAWD